MFGFTKQIDKIKPVRGRFFFSFTFLNVDGYSEKKKKTPQLTLTPNSATKRRIQCLSKSSLSSLPTPITLYVPVKFREIKSTSTADSSAPAACGTVPSVVPVCVEICTESRRGDRRRKEGRRGEKGAKGPERTAQRIGHSGYGGGGGSQRQELISDILIKLRKAERKEVN